ncbi:MAG TPA: FAD-dependent thymidylate synthase [Anaerolineales bacterium]
MRRSQRREGESDDAMDRRLRSQYVDVCRFLLPAASLANVGMTANARVLESTIRKMLSHPLLEVREIGQQIKAVASAEVPTLLKYADSSPYLVGTREDLNSLAIHLEPRVETEECRLIDYDRDGEQQILAAALYRFADVPYSQALDHVKALSEPDCAKLADALLKRLDLHDIPLRELEYCTYTFDLLMDQGAYAEFKRHRMMTQTAQKLTTRLGYAMPRLIEEAGIGSNFQAAMDAAATTYEKMRELSPELAQYVVPNAYNRRVLARFNLREAYAFCRLRTASNAHFSIRRIAWHIHDAIRQVHPRLAAYMHLPEESWQSVQDVHFAG